jgi:hypothetical protein
MRVVSGIRRDEAEELVEPASIDAAR